MMVIPSHKNASNTYIKMLSTQGMGNCGNTKNYSIGPRSNYSTRESERVATGKSQNETILEDISRLMGRSLGSSVTRLGVF